ncbi:MAG: 1-phosphofructokinase family hexose kinase, partial [Planctomycetales bacterium]
MILSAGLSPAWQHVLLVEDLRSGEVNRIKQSQWCAAGKVLNVAVALQRLGADSRSLTLVGGISGEAIKRGLDDLDTAWVEASVATRVCTSLIDTSRSIVTELVESAGKIEQPELDAFIKTFSREATDASFVVFTGSLPAGTPSTFCRDLMPLTKARFILDIRGAELTEALAQRPFMIKPNRSELISTLHRDIHNEDDLLEVMRGLNQLGAEWVMITDSDKAVYVTSLSEIYRLQPPQVPVVSPIGCGDCMAAGLATALDQGRDWPDALRFCVAVAAAKLGSPLPGETELDLAME